MRIAQITAGTGNFYCGACIRDQALVRGLRALGHDACILPLYLPMVGEHAEPQGEVFLGGINAYLQQKLSLFRHTPRWLDRLFDRRGLLVRAAALSGMTRPDDLGALTLSALEGRDGRQRKEVERLVEHLATVEKPEVLVLSNVLLLGFAAVVKERLGIPVLCTLQGEDTFLDKLPARYREACWKRLQSDVAHVDCFIGVSRYYAEVMARRMAIPEAKLRVVYNGIDLSGYAGRERHDDGRTIGYFSQLIPAKGLHTLVDAFLRLKRANAVPGLRLAIAGSTVPGTEAFLREQKAKIAASGFGADVSLAENVSREAKLDFLHDVSVLCVPSLYGESFGLYVIEAMAAGTPVVQPRHAAFPELIEATGGGVLYDPAAPEEPDRALCALLGDAERRAALGAAGRAAVQADFSADAMARAFDAVLRERAPASA